MAKNYIGSTGLKKIFTLFEGKFALASHGRHVSFTTTTPKMNGAAAVGTATTVSRSDHVHPVDTSRAASSHNHDSAYAAKSHTHSYAAVNHTHNYLPLSGGILTGHVNVNADNTYIFGGYNTNLLNVYTRNIENITGASLYVKSSAGAINLASPNGTIVSGYNSDNRAPISASAFNQNSSRRIKENIQEITNEEAMKILDVNIVTFDYIESIGGAKNQRGCIAEDVYEQIPYVVSGDINSKDPMDIGVDYSKFVPYLIKMVQIQQKEIDDLKSKNK